MESEGTQPRWDGLQDNIFTQYITAKNNVFKKDRDVLRPSFIPENLPHRREHLDKLASILAPAFKGDRPSNIMMYGKTGTGKTAVSLFLGKEIRKGRNIEAEQLGRSCGICNGYIPKGFMECAQNHDVSVGGIKCSKCGSNNYGDFDTCTVCKASLNQSMKCDHCGSGIYAYDKECSCGADNPVRFHRIGFFYINCEVVDTPYGILQNIGNYFVKEFDERIPPTGWSTERVYNAVRAKMDEERRTIVVVLDEVDNLVFKTGDDVLYQLMIILTE